MAIADVQKLYLAYYQRPADPKGLLFWSGKLEETGGFLSSILESFARSDESKALYGEITAENIEAVITSMYQGILGRAPDAEGLQFYKNQFLQGKMTAASIALNIVNGAKDTAGGAQDATLIQKKLQACMDFTKAIDPELDGAAYRHTYAGRADEVAGRSFLKSITATGTYDVQAFLAPKEGVVVDGYVKGATVFVDLDGNGVLDAGEPNTTTDNAGKFSLDAKGGKIVAFGGTDLLTGKPFPGVLKAPAGAPVVNPLTTLVQSMVEQGKPVAEAKAAVQQALNLPEGVNLLTFDPMAVLAQTDADEAAKAAALAVQKAAQKVSAVIAQAATAVETAGAADKLEAAQKAAEALVGLVAQAQAPIDLTQSAVISQVLAQVGEATGAQQVIENATALAQAAAAVTAQIAAATNVTALAQAAVVAQDNLIQTVTSGLQGGNLQDLINSFTQNIGDLINQAQPGQIVPGIPIPPLPPIPGGGGDAGGGGATGGGGGDTTPPVLGDRPFVFSVDPASVTVLASNKPGAIGLYAADGSVIGQTVPLTLVNGVYTGTLPLAAPLTPIEGVIKVASTAGVFAAETMNLYLGTDAANTVDKSGATEEWTIYGFDGNDTLTGGNGADLLIGGAGDDSLVGGPGNDAFEGLAGNDSIDLGTGWDQVRFLGTGNGVDTITGFSFGTTGPTPAGNEGDQLIFTDFLGASYTVLDADAATAGWQAFAATATGAAEVAGKVAAVTATNATDIDEASEVAGLFGADKPLQLTATGQKAVVLTGANGGNGFQVWYVMGGDSGAVAESNVTKVADVSLAAGQTFGSGMLPENVAAAGGSSGSGGSGQRNYTLGLKSVALGSLSITAEEAIAPDITSAGMALYTDGTTQVTNLPQNLAVDSSTNTATLDVTLSPQNWVLFTYDGAVGTVRTPGGDKYLPSVNAAVAKNGGAVVDLTAAGAMDNFVPNRENFIFGGNGNDTIKVNAHTVFQGQGSLPIFGGGGTDTFVLGMEQGSGSATMLMFPSLMDVSGSDVVQLGQYTGHAHITLVGNWTAGSGTSNESDMPMVFTNAGNTPYDVNLSAAGGSKGWMISGRAATSMIGSNQNDVLMFSEPISGGNIISKMGVNAGGGNDMVSTGFWQYTGQGNALVFAVDNLDGGAGTNDTLVFTDSYLGYEMPAGNTVVFDLTGTNWNITANGTAIAGGNSGITITGFETLDLKGIHVADGVVSINAKAQSTQYAVGVWATQANDTITSVGDQSTLLGALNIRGYYGNDTINLGANTADYVVFECLVDNGNDNINSFDPTMDVLNFAQFLGTTNSPAEKVHDADANTNGIQAVAANSTNPVDITGKVVIIKGSLDALQNPSHIAALFGQNKALTFTQSQGGPGSTPAKMVIVTTETNNNNFEIWFAVDQNGDGTLTPNDANPNMSEIRLVGEVALANSGVYADGLLTLNNFNFQNLF